MIPRSKIQAIANGTGTSASGVKIVASASIKRPSLNQTQPLPVIVIPLFIAERFARKMNVGLD